MTYTTTTPSVTHPRSSRYTLAPLVASAGLTAFSVLAVLAAPAQAAPVPATPAPATSPSAPTPPPTPSTSAQAPSQTVPASQGDTEIIVPPQGGTAEVPLHVGTVCILSFPEKLAPLTLVSSGADFEIRPWDAGSIAIRTRNSQATPATVALTTATGQIKINATLRVVPATEPALTLVRFKSASEAEAFEVKVKTEVAKGLAPLQQRFEQKEKELDARIRRGSDRQIAEQILRRSEVVRLNSHARNGDHVILHVWRALLLGDDGYLAFEIQNRSGSPYRLASVRVLASGRNVAGDAYLSMSPAVRDPALIGVVAPGATVGGVVAIPLAQALLRQPLTLEIAMPNGRSTVRAERGIALR